jgi:hypothetical protein
LAHWLNGPRQVPWGAWKVEFVQRFGFISGTSESDAKARDQIAHLLRKVKQFMELAAELYSEQDESTAKRDWLLLSGLQEWINKSFSNYSAYQTIHVNPPTSGKPGHFKPHFLDGRFYYWGISPVSNALLQELMAAKLIQDAERQGWLNQVKECSVCGYWFFARRREKLTCSPKCRKKEYQSSDRYKEWRHRHYLNHEKQRRIMKQSRPDPRRDK